MQASLEILHTGRLSWTRFPKQVTDHLEQRVAITFLAIIREFHCVFHIFSILNSVPSLMPRTESQVFGFHARRDLLPNILKWHADSTGPTCFFYLRGFVFKHWQLRRVWDLCWHCGARAWSSWDKAASFTAPNQPDQPVVRSGRASGTCRTKRNGRMLVIEMTS